MATTDGWHAASFRDPMGRVFWSDGRLYRAIHPTQVETFRALAKSGVLSRLIDRGTLISHREVDPNTVKLPPGADVGLVFEPESIEFVSYPWEWPFSALRDAALATLAVQREAIAHGFTLKDASAFNIQFHRGRATFIDTSSFEAMAEPRPWSGYRQFCRHFLAPLALMRETDPRLRSLWTATIDGIPLDLASRLLPRPSWLRFGLLAHLHLHARGEQAFAGAPGNDAREKRSITLAGLTAIIDSLENAIRSLTPRVRASQWSAYADSPPSYDAAARAARRELIARMLGEIGPRVVWDLGANTGEMSRLAAQCGADLVLAIDADEAAVDRCYRETRAASVFRVLPLVMDFANPSPALGFAHRERMSLHDRGPTDLALVLALIHHLAIVNHLPFASIAAWLRSIAKVVIVEWVPENDPLVLRLLRARTDGFTGYREDAFRAAFAQHFKLTTRTPISGSGRVLFRFES